LFLTGLQQFFNFSTVLSAFRRIEKLFVLKMKRAMRNLFLTHDDDYHGEFHLAVKNKL